MPTKKPEADAEPKPPKETKAKTAPPVPKAVAAKVFDIAHPGKTAAHAAGKPVIVGHTSMIKQDPMVAPVKPAPAQATPQPAVHREMTIKPIALTAEEPASELDPSAQDQVDTLAKTSSAGNGKKIITPPSEQEAEAEKTEDPEPATLGTGDEDAGSEAPAAAEKEDETEPVKLEPTEDVIKTPDSTSDDESESGPDLGANLKEKETKKAIDEEAAQKAAEVQELAESKKYFLKINTVEERRTRWVVVVVLLFVAVLSFITLAADADLLKLPGGLKAPTNFFSSSSAESIAAPTTNETQFQTYTSKIDGITIQYPKNWKLGEGEEGYEFAAFSPPDKVLNDQSVLFALNFARNMPDLERDEDIVQKYQIADISYEKLSKTGDNTLYMQQFIIKAERKNSTRYLAYFNITNSNNLKVGDLVSPSTILDTPFTISGGQDKLKFSGQIAPFSDGQTSSSSATLEAAQQYVKDSEIATQAKTILLSLKVPQKK